ncbi:hypothetical protein IC235_10875 [Hymenobacter sp. BT664]|uniref:Uncharacterized protein n=1 Tax=Hymenobacter montanus TaxID=2771359 RepID=A0A927BCR2_9BACT|nr:hypothetical protein [Hymenobacter montanus]MBD2768396.1 hypothetical protein [Hymenobacter montanus]
MCQPAPNIAPAPTLLHALDREIILTRRVFERLPDSQLDWQPHPKSRTKPPTQAYAGLLDGCQAAIKSM